MYIGRLLRTELINVSRPPVERFFIFRLLRLRKSNVQAKCYIATEVNYQLCERDSNQRIE
jgi:hypothetical protein